MSQSKSRSKTDAAVVETNSETELKPSKVFNEPSYKKIPDPINLDKVKDLDINEVIDDSKTPLSVKVEKATKFFSASE